MSELINKRVLLDALNEVSMNHHKSTIPMVEHDFRELINEMPTVDAVPVVRCKDCKYCEQRKTVNYLPFCFCILYDFSVRNLHYCSYGERKDGTK